MERDRLRIPLGTYQVNKPVQEFENSETLFKSHDDDLTEEYLNWFETAFMEFMRFYREARLDGTEDGLRCRMIAAIRLAQFGLNLFTFFGSCATSIKNGNADAEACNSTAKVVSMMLEKKVDSWITKAKRTLS
jgi:hypothetical protein